MSEVEVQVDQPVDEATEPVVRPEAQPIESRFLFVDVAALRAKQLRRGAKSRLEPVESEGTPVPAPVPVAVVPGAPGTTATARKNKAERVAMQEVRQRLVEWELPDFKAVFDIR